MPFTSLTLVSFISCLEASGGRGRGLHAFLSVLGFLYLVYILFKSFRGQGVLAFITFVSIMSSGSVALIFFVIFETS